MESPGTTAWRTVPAACALLAVPTLVAPDSPAASLTYLAPLVLVVGAVWRGALQLPGPARQAWLLLALAATARLAGDTVQRLDDALGVSTDSAGLPDLCWLASYPLLIAGTARMVGARRLARAQRTELRLDVLVVAVAAARRRRPRPADHRGGVPPRAAVRRPRRHRVQVRASVGVLTVPGGRAAGVGTGAPDPERVADDLLRSVDAAMYTAKRAGDGVRTAQLAAG